MGFLQALGTEYIPKPAAEFLRLNPDKNIRFEFHTLTVPENNLWDGIFMLVLGYRYKYIKADAMKNV